MTNAAAALFMPTAYQHSLINFGDTPLDFAGGAEEGLHRRLDLGLIVWTHMRWMNTLPEKFIEIDIFEPPTPLGTALHQDTCPYRNEVPQHHHHDLLSSRVDCRPPVLSNQYGCDCGKFGTKRLS